MNKLLFVFFFVLGIGFSSYSQQIISMQTSKGEILIKLYNDTPVHKLNFIKLIKRGFYDSLLFHRVMKDFMIQAGDPNSKGASRYKQLGGGGPGYDLTPEIKRKHIHKKGALAAARNPDDINPGKKSNGSQFYIVEGAKYPRKYISKFEEKNGLKYTEKEKITYESLGGSPHLDGEYTVFGEVVRGLDVLEKISLVKTNRSNRPSPDVYILKMKLIK